MTIQTLPQLRAALGLTQVEMAQVFFVHPVSLSKWERSGRAPEGLVSRILLCAMQVPRENLEAADVKAALRGRGPLFALRALLNAMYREVKP